MNSRIAYPFLLVLLCIAFSCKSESNTSVTEPQPAIEEIQPPENIKPDIVKPAETNKEVIEDSNTEVVEERSKPTNSKKTTKESKPEKKAKEAKEEKSNVDPGILIEMGADLEEESKDSKDGKDEKDVKDVKDGKDLKPEKPEREERFLGSPSHSKLDALLKAHVTSSGVVDYKGLKNKEAELDAYLKILSDSPPGTTWNRDQKLTYWINVYNAFTIKLILKNYPLKSITNLDGGKPWDVKWIKIGNQTYSLNNIENDIIRPRFNEPRIHFAVNCAAVSCPPLLNEAYKVAKLEQQLESQTKKFINNTKFNTLGKNEIKVSKIFDWYGGDFGDIASFVMRYASSTVKPSAKVTFNEYNWDLNGR